MEKETEKNNFADTTPEEMDLVPVCMACFDGKHNQHTEFRFRNRYEKCECDTCSHPIEPQKENNWRKDFIVLWKKLGLPDIDSSTYSGSKYAVMSLTGLIRSEAIKEDRERIAKKIEGMKKNAAWFEDNYFTAENAYPSFDKKADQWVTITAKETYNKALNEVVSLLTSKENE